jgi:hypothetical protein
LLIHLSLLLVSIMFSYALTKRRSKLRILAPILIIASMVTSPFLKGEALAQGQDRQAEGTTSLADALGMGEADEPEMKPPTHSQVAQMLNTPSGDVCGNTDLIAQGDSGDGYGTDDDVEVCLGTNPYNFDTDGDGITDTLEINGFVFTTTLNVPHTIYVNPFAIDSNEDGLSDFEEWPEPVGIAPSHDPDGDDLPNVWDDDNDGDGVPDQIDINPYVATDYQTDFDLQTTLHDCSYDGYQYITLQVQRQPINGDDHFRYQKSTLVWP